MNNSLSPFPSPFFPFLVPFWKYLSFSLWCFQSVVCGRLWKPKNDQIERVWLLFFHPSCTLWSLPFKLLKMTRPFSLSFSLSACYCHVTVLTRRPCARLPFSSNQSAATVFKYLTRFFHGCPRCLSRGLVFRCFRINRGPKGFEGV